MRFFAQALRVQHAKPMKPKPMKHATPINQAKPTKPNRTKAKPNQLLMKY